MEIRHTAPPLHEDTSDTEVREEGGGVGEGISLNTRYNDKSVNMVFVLQ